MWRHSIDCRLDFGKNDGPTFHPPWQFVAGIPHILYVSIPDAYLASFFHLSILGTQRTQALNKAKFSVIITTRFVRMVRMECMTVSFNASTRRTLPAVTLVQERSICRISKSSLLLFQLLESVLQSAEESSLPQLLNHKLWAKVRDHNRLFTCSNEKLHQSSML